MSVPSGMPDWLAPAVARLGRTDVSWADPATIDATVATIDAPVSRRAITQVARTLASVVSEWEVAFPPRADVLANGEIGRAHV